MLRVSELERETSSVIGGELIAQRLGVLFDGKCLDAQRASTQRIAELVAQGAADGHTHVLVGHT